MKNGYVKLCVGIMLVLAALILNSVIPVPAAGQLQVGHIAFIIGLTVLLAGGVVLICLGARQIKREGRGEKRKQDKI